MSNDNQEKTFAIALVKNLPRSFEDEVTAVLFEYGAEGVSEDLPFVQKDLRYDPEVVETADVVLKAYFSQPLPESERLELENLLRKTEPGIQFSMSLEAHRDWLEEWKKGFVPFRFAEPFWVVPKWCPKPEPIIESHVIWMDPGMAFGTGTHETTRLAASLIVPWMASQGKNAKVLDVGTGTGILALITERLGAKRAIGIDIDPEARRTARENLELNSAKLTIIDERELRELVQECRTEEERFDLTIANIIDGVLLTLGRDLADSVRRGGSLILSGILTDREAQFHREFASLSGLKEIKRVHEGEWCASLWRKA